MMTKTMTAIRWQSRPGIWLGSMLLVFTLSAHAEQFFWGDQSQRVAYGYTMANWQLNNVHVASQGQAIYPREGTLTRQYELQADAVSTSASGDVPANARFRLVMDVFSPAHDMGGQKKGQFYVQGLWELQGDEDVVPSADSALTGKIQGRVQSELSFDPTAENRDWKGIVQIPMTRVRSDGGKPGIRPMRGGGELVISAGNSGTLALDLKLWPKF
ncbi:MAG: hypothetical protein P8166_06335 [Candidatus Thiodiazotropha sp.]